MLNIAINSSWIEINQDSRVLRGNKAPALESADLHLNLLLVSWGCCNKVCQKLYGLKQQKFVLSQFCKRSKNKEDPSLPLPAFGSSSHSLVCSCNILISTSVTWHSPSVSVFLWHFPLLIKTPVIGLGPTLMTPS